MHRFAGIESGDVPREHARIGRRRRRGDQRRREARFGLPAQRVEHERMAVAAADQDEAGSLGHLSSLFVRSGASRRTLWRQCGIPRTALGPLLLIRS